MFCSHCGKQIADNARFCGHCGLSQEFSSQQQTFIRPDQQPIPTFQQNIPPIQQNIPTFQQNIPPIQQNIPSIQQNAQPYLQPGPFIPPFSAPYPGTSGLVGFSPKIQDPAFFKYMKSSSRYALVFAAVLAVIATIGMPIYGNASGEIAFPQSLYYGMIIGGMFLLIAIVQTLRKGTDSTWDGVVIDKKSVRRTQSDNDSDIHHHFMEYRFTVQRESGKKYRHTFRDQPAMYDYYREGDRVRHHKGSTYYEKYDKSRDSEILCAACLTMNPIGNDFCLRCKCPLLKC